MIITKNHNPWVENPRKLEMWWPAGTEGGVPGGEDQRPGILLRKVATGGGIL